jgi:predicted RNase H-like HicB family nuclease
LNSELRSLTPVIPGRVGRAAEPEETGVKDYHINIFWSDEDGGYVADIPDLEACSAFGTTQAEALAEVQRAKAAWLETARAEGKPR